MVAITLPDGSVRNFEGPVSGADLAAGISGRRARLGEVAQDNDSLQAFLSGKFDLALEEAAQRAAREYEAASMDFDAPIAERERTLSPSDFGFHNVLRVDGSLFFVDFEYAGWDDPAKLICDFGCHPEIPVSDEYLQALKNSFYPYLENAENSIHRSEILMPLYRLKWCCIMLNEFTSVGRARRKFAGEIFDFENQFQKSKTYFNKYLN